MSRLWSSNVESFWKPVRWLKAFRALVNGIARYTGDALLASKVCLLWRRQCHPGLNASHVDQADKKARSKFKPNHAINMYPRIDVAELVPKVDGPPIDLVTEHTWSDPLCPMPLLPLPPPYHQDLVPASAQPPWKALVVFRLLFFVEMSYSVYEPGQADSPSYPHTAIPDKCSQNKVCECR